MALSIWLGEKARYADAEEARRTGGMIALVPRPDYAQMLAVPNGEVPDELHVTLAYLGDDVTSNDPSSLALAVAQVADSYSEITARIFGHGVFNPDNHEGKDTCSVYLVGHAPELTQIHDDIVQSAQGAYPIPDQHEPWLPHITAQYADVPEVGEYTGPVVFDRLKLTFAGDEQDFPLHGSL